MPDPTTTSGGSSENERAADSDMAAPELERGPERSVLVGTNRTAQALEEKIDRLLGLLGEEINIYPDVIYPHVRTLVLPISTNASVPFLLEAEILDRTDGHRWLVLKLKDPNLMEIVRREWKCVWRDPYTGQVVDRPGGWR